MEQHFPKIRKLSPIFKHCYLEFPSNLNFLSELLVTQLTFWKLNKLEIARLIGKHLVFGCVQRVSWFYFSVFSLVLIGRHCKHSRPCLATFSNISKLVENLKFYFFSLFNNVLKLSLSCLPYYTSWANKWFPAKSKAKPGKTSTSTCIATCLAILNWDRKVSWYCAQTYRVFLLSIDLKECLP